MKERRKAFREGLKTGILTNLVWSSSRSYHPEERRVLKASQNLNIDDFDDDDWSTEEEDCNEMTTSADVRQKRLKVMENLPECFDKDMAGRLEILKKVNIWVLSYVIYFPFSGWK